MELGEIIKLLEKHDPSYMKYDSYCIEHSALNAVQSSISLCVYLVAHH